MHGALPAPEQLMVLRQGWTFDPGVRSDVKELIGSSADSVQPLENVHTFLARYPAPAQGWLRCQFTVPTNWPVQQYTLTVLQSVARGCRHRVHSKSAMLNSY